MKFISWNVNGLRACMQKGFLDFFKEIDADIFCLQETKLQEGQIDLDLPGYHQYWNYAEKKGYSGTAIFTKEEPLQVTYGIGVEEHDHEGRVITAEYPEFYFVTVYVPNAQQELKRLDYRMQWEADFLAYLKKLEEKKPVIYAGDLNVAHQEIDLKNPKTNRGNAGFTDGSAPASPKYWKMDLSTLSAIFIRSRPESIPGGLTDSRRGRKMPDGELTISWCHSACRTDWRMRRSTRKFRDRIIARSSLIYNRQKTAKGDL